ncbi:hypothetical protein Tco_1517389 [Tanacetum coccineum]
MWLLHCWLNTSAVSYGSLFLLENLGLLAGSERLSDKIRVLFDQSLKEEESLLGLLRDLCCSLRLSLSKKRRLAAELEGLGQDLDVLRELERMKEIVARDAGTLVELEKLLARVHVGVGLKKGYVAELKDTA